MREFLVYSATATTAPFIKDLKGAGRMDILFHAIISALFASHTMREDTRLHLLLMGPPNAPRHITLEFNPENTISKKDMKKLIEMCLRKCYPGKLKEVHPGVFVEEKPLDKVLEEAKERSSSIFMLDAHGDHVKEIINNDIDSLKNPFFVLGDHDGFDKQAKKFLKKNTKRISLGPQMYLTSQAITILNYELDNI